jgi:hypothetical protein
VGSGQAVIQTAKYLDINGIKRKMVTVPKNNFGTVEVRVDPRTCHQYYTIRRADRKCFIVDFGRLRVWVVWQR